MGVGTPNSCVVPEWTVYGILKVELNGFTDGLDVGCKRRKKIDNDS